MTEQNEREWPSFNDILEELNSLGRLPSTMTTRTSSSNPLERSHPTTITPPAVETTAPEPSASIEVQDLEVDELEVEDLDELEVQDPEVVDSEVDELSVEPNWAPTEATADPSGTTDLDESAPLQEALTSLSVDGIDWSSWDFGAAPPPAAELLQDFTIEPQADIEHSNDPTPIFEFEIGDESKGPIDSVATADAIETDLHELFGMVDQEETEVEADTVEPAEDPADDRGDTSTESDPSPEMDDRVDDDAEAVVDDGDKGDDDGDGADNVVPLHRPGDDLTHHLVGLDDVFDPSAPPAIEPAARAAEFVGIDQPPPKKADSWEYLRPGEDDTVKSGRFSRRPKFFGGAERKARKAERKQAEAKAELTGPPCPKCDSPGRIDLNDPVGGKIHCSCLECDHVWSQLAPPTQESA